MKNKERLFEVFNKVNGLNENKINRVKINEASLNRILSKHYRDGFIIVTNIRNENSDAENKSGFEQLKGDVKSAGYSFIPVYGGFIENKDTEDEVEVEQASLFVPNHKVATTKEFDDSNSLKELGIQLSRKYNQDSFLYKPKGEDDESFFIDKNGNVDTKFSNKTLNDLTQIYFTRLTPSAVGSDKFLGNKGKTDKADRRFTFSESIYINEPPKSNSEAVKRYGEQFFRINS